MIDDQEDASATNLVHVLRLAEGQNLVKLLHDIVASPLADDIVVISQHSLKHLIKELINLSFDQLDLVHLLEHLTIVHIFLAVADDAEAVVLARAGAVFLLAGGEQLRIVLVDQSLRHG